MAAIERRKISPMMLWLWIAQGLMFALAATIIVMVWDKGKELEQLGLGAKLGICVVAFFLVLVQGLVIHIFGTWLYHRFVQTEARKWYDGNIVDVVNAFNVAYRGGIWVEPKRSRLNRHYYNYLISTANEVRVLGIANTSFMQNFEKDFPDTDAAGSFNLEHSMRQPLFDRLRAPGNVKVDVLFLDPRCSAAQERSKEPNNEETLSDLYKVGRALRRVKEAYAQDPNKNKWLLAGRLKFHAIKKIPENSITFVNDMHDPKKTMMVVGTLPQGEFGVDCPSIIIQRLDELQDLYRTFSSRVDEMMKDNELTGLAFTWDADGPRLEEWLETWLLEWEDFHSTNSGGAKTNHNVTP